MPAITPDNQAVTITAHVRTPEELKQALLSGVDGIGLLETDFAADLFSEEAEEKYYTYFREAADQVGGKTVALLLPDLGRKKSGPEADQGGIRHFLANPQMYGPFLRAVLRASACGPLELALPMVSRVSEVIAFREIVGELRSGLEREGRACSLPVAGVVVETPSVIPAVKSFMFDAGFFMVGENYPKYLMADITINNNGTEIYFSQAFLMQAQSLVDSLKRRKEGARIYGPALHDTVAVAVLLGLGFSQLVAPPGYINDVKSCVESINIRDARLIAAKTSSYWDPCQARDYAAERVTRLKGHSVR